MTEKGVNVIMDLLNKAFEESKSETVDLVVEHELPGVTPEMIDWWWPHIYMANTLWHPTEHIAFRYEELPSKSGQGGPTKVAVIVEKVSESPASELRLRIEEDQSSFPIPTTYDHVNMSTILGSGDKPIGWIHHDYIARSTFRFPAKTPKQFLEAMRKHNIGEMGQFPKFLPELYKQHAG